MRLVTTDTEVKFPPRGFRGVRAQCEPREVAITIDSIEGIGNRVLKHQEQDAKLCRNASARSYKGGLEGRPGNELNWLSFVQVSECCIIALSAHFGSLAILGCPSHSLFTQADAQLTFDLIADPGQLIECGSMAFLQGLHQVTASYFKVGYIPA